MPPGRPTRTTPPRRCGCRGRRPPCYEVRSGDQPLELVGEPVLRWSNPVAGDIHGAVYLWTRGGRPLAAASLHRWFAPKTDMEHEFTSLAEGRVSARFRGTPAWEAGEAGVRFEDVPGAPAPAAGEAQRLFQMRQLVKEFTAAKTVRGGAESELRLLPQPVHRYAAPADGVVRGGLFAFVQGTDPDVFLLVEARGPDASPRWQVAAARMTGAGLRLRHRGREVWTAALLPWSEFVNPHRAYANFVFKDVPDFLKPALGP